MRRYPLKNRFVSGVPEDEQDELRELFALARPVRERLSQVMKEKADAENANLQTQYESPSWAYKQADLNGYLRAMKLIQTYLED